MCVCVIEIPGACRLRDLRVVSTPRVSIGPAGSRMNRDHARLGYRGVMGDSNFNTWGEPLRFRKVSGDLRQARRQPGTPHAVWLAEARGRTLPGVPVHF